MGVPKSRRTKHHQRMRRMHIFLQNPSLTSCSHCGEKILPHQVCPSCGYYKGEKVIEPLIKEKKKKK